MSEAFRKPGHRRNWTICFRRSETLLRLVFYVISRLVTRTFDFSLILSFPSCVIVIIISHFFSPSCYIYTVNYYCGCLCSADEAKKRYSFCVVFFFRLRGPDKLINFIIRQLVTDACFQLVEFRIISAFSRSENATSRFCTTIPSTFACMRSRGAAAEKPRVASYRDRGFKGSSRTGASNGGSLPPVESRDFDQYAVITQK